MRVAERALAAIGGTPVALGAVVLALLVTRVTWPLFAQTPYALLFIAILIAAQWADDMPGLLAIPLAAVGHLVLFRIASPVAFGEWSLVVFVVLAFGMNRLIVTRRRTEAALRASEAELRSAWEHAAMGEAILDLQGHVIRINPALARMLGCHEQGRNGVHYREMMQSPDSQEEEALFLDLVHGRRDEYWREQAYRTENGTVIWARAVMSLVRDDRGPTGAILMLENVTDRKALEEHISQIQKPDAMGRLVASVAHDFNNLLTAIGGYAELAREEVDDPLPRRQLDEVLAATCRATALTRQLLMFSRRPSIDPTPSQLDGVITAMTSLLERLAGRSVAVVTRLGAAGAAVKLDPSHIEQIIVNLVVNARHAMPEGGTLSIETALVQLPGAEDVSTRAAQPSPGSYVLLTVSDTGIGMDEQVKRRLFEPFFTTKEADEGTGLGLATVYGIVKQSGAYIWVESEPRHGSRFKIYFPQVPPVLESTPSFLQGPPPESVPLATTVSGPSRSTGVLVVEDDGSVRAFTCAVLRNAGYDALGASTGEEAMELASTHSSPLDLIVTDVALPGISGADLVRQLRRMCPQARILFASGFSALALQSQGVINETGGFLQKPFTRHQLLAAVQARLADRDIGGVTIR